MTTRDPRSRPTPYPEPTGVGGPAREPTQSIQLQLPADDARERRRGAHPSIAVGTHDVSPGGLDALPDDGTGSIDIAPPAREDRTRVESPGARSRTPAPARPLATRPPPLPPVPSARGSEEGEHVGSVLGSYRIAALLGKGGMGYVFRAEHVKLGREVALKLLRSDYAKRRDAVLRFFQEAKTVNRVRHRNIVDVTDFVELPDGTTFIIMELLSGESLGKWARSGVELPRALGVLVQICDGLFAAHQVGVVHRDLKPDNIIVTVTPEGTELVKLLDFGVAKLLNRDDEDIGFQTAAGSVIGTPAYMSPEQAGGMTVDARSDIYSLGAIMYELFCGQPMFRGRSFGEYVRKHLTEMPPPPRATTAGAQMDPRLEALILRCLQKEPADRFPHIGELRDALLGLIGSMSGEWRGHAGLAPITPLSASAARSLPTYSGPAVTVTPLSPQLPVTFYAPGHGSQAGSGMGPGPGSGLGSAVSGYSQVHVPPTGIQSPSTPWWIWLGGGVAAVGLGIGAAVMYAGGSATTAPAGGADGFTARAPVGTPPPSTLDLTPGPTPTPAPTPTPTPTPEATATLPALAPLEVKLDSMPSGSVFADGHAAELCRTPCSFVIDPEADDASTLRTYVVRAAGYRDAQVQVDLHGEQRAFRVSLERAEPASAGTHEGGRRPRAGGGGGGGKKPPVETTPPPTRPTKPVTKHGPIDPTETIDPFKK